MKRAALFVGLLVLATTPSASRAGGSPDAAEICGASGCVGVADADDVTALALLAGGFTPLASHPPAETYYTVRLTNTRLSEFEPWRFVYEPATGDVRVDAADFSLGAAPAAAGASYWVRPVGPTFAEVIERSIQGLAPITAAAAAAPSAPTGDDDRSRALVIAGLVVV